MNRHGYVPVKLYLQNLLNSLWDLVFPPLVQMQSNTTSAETSGQKVEGQRRKGR